MRPKEVTEYLRSIIDYKEAPAIFIWGPPGVGKSDVVRDVARFARANGLIKTLVGIGKNDSGEIGFIDLRLALMDPSDLRGIPVPKDGKAFWLPPSALPTEGGGILLLDEFNHAPPLVQSSAYQLVLDRKLGEYQLPPDWRIIAAGNKTEHGGNTYKMPMPLRNRFVHIDFDVNVDDWREWAVLNEIHSDVVEFISFRPDLLFQFDPKRNENAFPTPRSWEFASRQFKNERKFSQEIMNQIIDGTVGVAAATEFRAYIKMREKLPAIDSILSGENFVPMQIDVACAIAAALVMRAKPEQYNRLIEYLNFLPVEVAYLLAQLLILKDKNAVIKCPLWKGWAGKHASLIA